MSGRFYLYIIFWICFEISLIFSYTPPGNFCQIVDNRCRELDIEHIFCSNEKFKKVLSFPEKSSRIVLDEFTRQDIIYYHNKYRNEIACGYLDSQNLEGRNLPAASKMYELQWDDELEWIADLNTRTCRKNFCPFTEQFLYGGQNFELKRSKKDLDYKIFVYETIKKWKMGYLHTPIDSIYNFHDFSIQRINNLSSAVSILSKEYLASSSSFQTLASDGLMKIGCALYNCGPSNTYEYSYAFSCIYGYISTSEQPKAFIKEWSHPIYKTSLTAGSECKARSKTFNCLCIDSIVDECSCKSCTPVDEGKILDKPAVGMFNSRFKLFDPRKLKKINSSKTTNETLWRTHQAFIGPALESLNNNSTNTTTEANSGKSSLSMNLILFAVLEFNFFYKLIV